MTPANVDNQYKSLTCGPPSQHVPKSLPLTPNPTPDALLLFGYLWWDKIWNYIRRSCSGTTTDLIDKQTDSLIRLIWDDLPASFKAFYETEALDLRISLNEPAGSSAWRDSWILVAREFVSLQKSVPERPWRHPTIGIDIEIPFLPADPRPTTLDCLPELSSDESDLPKKSKAAKPRPKIKMLKTALEQNVQPKVACDENNDLDDHDELLPSEVEVEEAECQVIALQKKLKCAEEDFQITLAHKLQQEDALKKAQEKLPSVQEAKQKAAPGTPQFDEAEKALKDHEKWISTLEDAVRLYNRKRSSLGNSEARLEKAKQELECAERILARLRSVQSRLEGCDSVKTVSRGSPVPSGCDSGMPERCRSKGQARYQPY